MNPQDIRTLQILEAIESNDAPSQRDLAESLNISLGLINSFVRRLTKKGYFKITHLPRNRVSYILTPKGIAEKSRLTYAYVQLSYRFYRDARQKTGRLFHQLEADGIVDVAFFGEGDLAEIAYLSLQETTLSFVAIGDFETNGCSFFGHRVLALGELLKMPFEALILTHANSDDGLAGRLVEKGVDVNRIKAF